MNNIQSTVRPESRPSFEQWVREFRVGTNLPVPKDEKAIELNDQYSRPFDTSWKNILSKLLLMSN